MELRLIYLFLVTLPALKSAGQTEICSSLQHYACYEADVTQKKDSTPANSWKSEIRLLSEMSSLPLYFLSDQRNRNPGKFHSELALRLLHEGKFVDWKFLAEDRSALMIYKDSIVELSADLSKISTQVEVKAKNKKTTALAEFSCESAKFPVFGSHVMQDGSLKRIPVSGFMSPGIVRCKLGFSYSSTSGNRLEWGIPAGRISWINNKDLYELNNTSTLSGILQEEKFDFDGGLSILSELKFPENKKWKFEHRSSLFYPLTKDGKPEARMENKLSLKLLETLNASLINRYTYEANRWPPGMWITEMSLAWQYSH